KPVLYGFGENGNTDISAGELFPRKFLAHSNYVVIEDDDFHRLIPPQRVHDHRDRRMWAYGEIKDFRIEDDVSIKNNETVAAQPIKCEPERINVISDSECRIFDEVNLLSEKLSGMYMCNDLFLLISDNNGDIIDSNHR